MEITEIIGYAASILVALSLSMKNIVRLRIWNLAGAVLFTVYGTVISAWPVVAVNGWIAVVNVLYLLKMRKPREFFDLIPVNSKSDSLFRKFTDHFAKDLRSFFPGFDPEKTTPGETLLILRNLRPVGIFVTEKISPEKVFIHADYVTPDYRDLQNGQFIFDQKAPEWRNAGIRMLETRSHLGEHSRYLLKMGFKPHEQAVDVFQMPL